MDRNATVEASPQVATSREGLGQIAEQLKSGTGSGDRGSSPFAQLTSNPFFTAVCSVSATTMGIANDVRDLALLR